ncbi:MAG TPA: AMP-binding protein [Spirochaetota bacterium]|nr:AMP-binding protein [Spirochaetota bacterium]
MTNFLSLFEHSNFTIENNDKIISKEELNRNITNLYENLRGISPLWKDKLVYIDIKDRVLFFILFFTLIKLEAKIVLVPNEIKEEDYLNSEDIFITDNKNNPNFIIIDNNLTINNIPDLSDRKTHYNFDTFYLYTSGSTGKAKLIPKKFENIYIELKELKKIFNIENNWVFYFTPALYHIYGFLFGLALPIYCNATVILTQHFTPESIIEFIEKKDIDIFISIPYYYSIFEKIEKINSFKPIKNLISSSAPFPLELSKIYYENGIKVTEIYGSTETGGIAYRISAIDPEWKLFSYVKIKSHFNEKEVELFIQSPAISIFYDTEIGYNTGDIVEFKTNNSFILLGRNTRFSKIAGKRVDLNFIQNKIIDILSKEFSITLFSDDIYIFEKDKNIVMLYDIKEDINIEKLKHILKKHLPSYSVPRIFIKSKIPRNNMNKIDKQEVDKIYNYFISER